MRRKLGLIRVEGRSGSEVQERRRRREGGARCAEERFGNAAAIAIAFSSSYVYRARCKSKSRIYHLRDLKAKQPCLSRPPSLSHNAVLQLCCIIASGRLFGSDLNGRGDGGIDTED